MASLPKILCELDKLEPGILRNLYDNFLKNNEAALNAEDGDGHKITSETLQEWAQSDVLSDYGKAMAANSAYRMAYAIVDAIAVSISGGGYFPGYYNSGYFFKTYIPFPAPGQMQYQDPYVPEKGKVYVDMQDGSIYIWNDVSKIYFAIGGKSGGGGGTVTAVQVGTSSYYPDMDGKVSLATIPFSGTDNYFTQSHLNFD